MKLSIVITTLCIAIHVSVYLFVYCYCIDRTHKYEIEYPHGKYTFSDYTDTFQLTPTSIKYIDDKGVEIIRYGTFSVKENQDYKKYFTKPLRNWE